MPTHGALSAGSWDEPWRLDVDHIAVVFNGVQRALPVVGDTLGLCFLLETEPGLVLLPGPFLADPELHRLILSLALPKSPNRSRNARAFPNRNARTGLIPASSERARRLAVLTRITEWRITLRESSL